MIVIASDSDGGAGAVVSMTMVVIEETVAAVATLQEAAGARAAVQQHDRGTR